MRTYRDRAVFPSRNVLLYIPLAYAENMVIIASAHGLMSHVSVCMTLHVSGKTLNEAMHYACTNYHDRAVVVLLAAGADVHHKHERTLQTACAFNAYKIIPILIAAGADVNAAIEHCDYGRTCIARLRKLL